MRYYNITVGIISFFLFCMSESVSHADHTAGHIHRPQIFLSEIPPLIMRVKNEDAGMLVDLSYALIDELQSTGLDIRPSPKILPWARAYKLVQNTPNVIMLQMARTPYREDLFHWVDNTTDVSWSFVTTIGPAINTIEEAKKLDSIAVYRASRIEDQLRELGFDENLAPNNNSHASARMLNGNRVQAWYTSKHAAQWLYNSGVLKKKPIIGKPIITVPLWMIVSKSTSPEMLGIFKKAIRKLKKTGLTKALNLKYKLDENR